jgi:hypothetical protein
MSASAGGGEDRRERRLLGHEAHVDGDHLVLRAGRVDVGRLPDEQVGARLGEWKEVNTWPGSMRSVTLAYSSV